MPGKGATNAMFALRILIEKYGKGQRELHYVIVDLEKAYDRVPTEELWYCIEKMRNARKIYATCTKYVQYVLCTREAKSW